MVRLTTPLAALTQRLTRPHGGHATRALLFHRPTQLRISHVAWRHHRHASTKNPPSSISPEPLPTPPTRPPSSQAAAQASPTVELTDREMLMRLLRRPQRQWYWLGGAAIVIATLVAFGPELKLGVSKHTAEVATKSLQDETLQRNTRELASQIIQTVLNDAKVLDQASFFIQRLVVMDATRDALQSLVVHTLNDATTLAHVTTLAKTMLAQLLDDANTRALTITFLRQTVQDPETRAALLKLLDEIMKDATMQQNLANLLAQTFTTDPVKTSVATTIGESVHDVLSRPDIQNHAKQFVGTVVQDQTVQAQSGDAIWGTVMYAITPGWLSWIWEHGDDKHTPVTAVVAVPVVQAEADTLVGEAADAFSTAVEAQVEREEADKAQTTKQTTDEEIDAETETNTNAAEDADDDEDESVASPPPSRFEMLRRLTMRLPLLSSSSTDKEKEKERKAKDAQANEEEQKRLADEQQEHDAEHHWRGAGGTGLF